MADNTVKVSNIKAKQVIGYVMLPGIIPRLRALFSDGFGYVAFLMASIYAMVRLLPPEHPYLNYSNMGKFGIRHVIAEAANNLVISRRNLDQIFIFMVLLAGVMILVIQFVLIIYGLVIQPAFAQVGGSEAFKSFFIISKEQAKFDIAFMLLDRVFGIPNMFGSCVAERISCIPGETSHEVIGSFPTPFHNAMHEMFAFYSNGLLAVGVLIFSYFVIVVVGETAVTGTPFGQRFQNVWVPIRLVVAIGLLVPLGHGLNSGQYIALHAAKAGSSFATNGWNEFNKRLQSSPVGVTVFDQHGPPEPLQGESLLALPGAPDVGEVLQAVSLAHGCAHLDWIKRKDISSKMPQAPHKEARIKPYMIRLSLPVFGGEEGEAGKSEVEADGRKILEAKTTFKEAVQFFGGDDIILRFGAHEEGDDNFGYHLGQVQPTCGELRVRVTDLSGLSGKETAAWKMQEYYFNLVKQLWFGKGATGGDNKLIELSKRYVAREHKDGNPCGIAPNNRDLPGNKEIILKNSSGKNIKGLACEIQEPPVVAKTEIVGLQQSVLNLEIQKIWREYSDPGKRQDKELLKEIQQRGWGGAGIWYNTIAQVNGGFVSAVANVPERYSYPLVMEKMRDLKRGLADSVSPEQVFVPAISDSTRADITRSFGGDDGVVAMASVLSSFFRYWNRDILGSGKLVEKTENPFIDGMHMIFGTYGLTDMMGKSAHVHPLAQLSTLGKGIVEYTIRNIGISSFAGALSGPGAVLGRFFGAAGEAVNSFLGSTALIGLTAGLMLYYILPFLPFLIFFFAVASWIKGLFEAMVGIPLWALAHLRIDGEGLPGEAAANGYYLIFDVFVRPILTVFGLIAAIIIFTAQVRILHFTWMLAVDNIGGFDNDPLIHAAPKTFVDAANPEAGTVENPFSFRRSIIDQFMFTVLYTMVVYMMATASFKLIDRVPDEILRWMGSSVAAFADADKDPTRDLQQYAVMGGMTVGRQFSDSLNKASKEAGGALGSFLRSVDVSKINRP